MYAKGTRVLNRNWRNAAGSAYRAKLFPRGSSGLSGGYFQCPRYLAVKWALFLLASPLCLMQIPCTTDGAGLSIIPNVLPDPLAILLGSLL